MNSINIHIDAGRRAEAPCEAYIIADNNDITISFTFADGSGFDTTASMTAVLVTAQGKLPDITFSAGQITVPRLVAADGDTLRVGVSQGNIKTTEAARIRVVPSVYTMAHGRTAPDPENPSDYDALPTAESVSMEDEVIITDVSAGKRERATLQLLFDLFGAESGHSPFIGTNGNWYEWDAEAGEYIDTGMAARGPQGPQGATGPAGPAGEAGFSPTASVVKNNGVITIAITDKNGTTTATLNECDIAFVTTGNSYEQLRTLCYAGKRLVLSLSTTQTNDRYVWLNEYTGSSFIFIEQSGYGYIEHECLEYVGWHTTTYDLDSAPTQNSTKPVKSGGVFAALDKKVSKEAGKGLSTNDYDNEAKAKVDAIPADPHYDAGTFDAIYGVTTWAEFASAVQAGKSIKVVDGTNYGWADIIDIDHEYASFVIISGEDFWASWCEFGNNDGVNEWSAWRGDVLVPESILQTALAAKQDKTAQVEITTDGAVTQALDAGRIYLFSGALTSLTITLNAPASGQLPQYHFIFTAGATAPTVTLPNSVQMPDDWAVDTNTRYEIDILDGYGLASSWEVIQE